MHEKVKMNETEKMLFDTINNPAITDEMASASVGLFAAPDKVKEPDAQTPNLDIKDESGLTLLHHAVRRGFSATVSRLLEKGASVDIKDKNRNTALVHAMKKLPERNINDPNINASLQSDETKIVEKLVMYSADVQATDYKSLSKTCLHLAVKKNHYPALKALLQKQTNPSKCLEITDSMGQTPLHRAIVYGDQFIVGYLLNEAKANPNYVSLQSGLASLHYAALHDKAQIVPVLIKAGADSNMKSKNKTAQKTPLEIAQQKNHHAFIKALDEEVKVVAHQSQNSNSSINYSPAYY